MKKFIFVVVIFCLLTSVCYAAPKFAMLDKVQDTITGYTGQIVAIVTYLSGAYSYAIQSQTLVNGKPVTPAWVDEKQLIIVQ